jgi:hypothetical protein
MAAPASSGSPRVRHRVRRRPVADIPVPRVVLGATGEMPVRDRFLREDTRAVMRATSDEGRLPWLPPISYSVMIRV